MFLKSHQDSTVVFDELILAHIDHGETLMAGKRPNTLIQLTLKDWVKHDKSASLLKVCPGEVDQSFEDHFSLCALDFTLVEFLPVLCSLFCHFQCN